jgi:serine protease Do
MLENGEEKSELQPSNDLVLNTYMEVSMKTTKVLSVVMIVSVLVLAGFSAASLSLSSLGVVNGVALAQTAPTAVAPVPVSNIVPATSNLAAFESTFEQIYTQVNPSVVNIQVVEQATTTTGNGRFGNNSPFGQPQVSQALGSGFVWDKQGDIVTNNHVVNGATSISVTFADGTTVDAKVVGQDPNADLAVIKVDVAADKLQPVTVADSTQVKVGQIVIAIGNPFGFSGSMSQGIVSGLSRTIPADSSNSATGGTYAIPDIIQTDAAINPGNSGGVLVDDQGQLIGVTSAMESSSNSSSGVGFVIPSAIVEKVVPALIKDGKYDHPYLGLSGTTLTPDLAQAMNLKASQKGVLVITVVDNGPSAKAGLKPSDQAATVSGQQMNVGGDVITAVNGQAVNRFEDLTSYLLSQTAPGQTVTLTVLRGGQEQSVKLTLGTLPTN